MRLVLWLSPILLLLMFVSAAPNTIHVNLRFNNTATIETGTWNVTFNLSQTWGGCGGDLYTTTQNLTTDPFGELSTSLPSVSYNFTDATYLCIVRNQTFIYDTINLSPTPHAYEAHYVNASGILDASTLNLSRHGLDTGNISHDGFYWTVQNVSNFMQRVLNLTGANSSLPAGGVNYTHRSNFSNDRNYTRNTSPVNFTPYDVETRYLFLENDSVLQSVLWFRTVGVNRGSWFWNNKSNTYALGTYLEDGSWNGYAWWLNNSNKKMRVYGDLVVGMNASINDTLYAKNISATTLEGNISYSNLTGGPPNFTQGLNATGTIQGMDSLNFSNNASLFSLNTSCLRIQLNSTIIDLCK